MQSNASTVDPRPNPQYVSHMPPIFTEQYRCEQELQEKNRDVEADHQRRAKLSKQGIIIYAWYQVRVFLLHLVVFCFQQVSYRIMSHRLSMSCRRGSHGLTSSSQPTS